MLKNALKKILYKFHLIRFSQFIFFYFIFIKKCFYTLSFILSKSKKNRNKLKTFLRKNDFKILITHNIGGGTGDYTKRLLSENENFIVLSNTYEKTLFYYDLFNITNKNHFYISKKQIKTLFKENTSEIIINSLFSFSEINFFLNELIKLKQKNKNIKLSYNVHDFHCICPNINLIHKNSFCNLDCKKHKCLFFTPLHFTNSIKKWRKKWSNFLSLCDSIICFSNSSKTLIERSYGSISLNTVVTPHNLSYCTFTRINNIDSFPFNLAIIGNINNAAKGVFILEYLAKNLNPYGIEIQIIGTELEEIKNKIKIYPNMIFYGKYKQEELQKIVTTKQISLVAFTSICPETFSFLTSELLIMEIPIVSFNIGAQEEKISHYKKGKIVNTKEELLAYILHIAKFK